MHAQKILQRNKRRSFLLTPEGLCSRLSARGIEYRLVEHPPFFTVAQSQRQRGDMQGGHCKNLFLKDRKGALFLVTVQENRRVDFKRLAALMSCARLSFGAPELLEELLGVKPGSVTPLAAVNDVDGRVKVAIDRELLTKRPLNCHPLRNDATIQLQPEDLISFLREHQHPPLFLSLEPLSVERAQPKQGALPSCTRKNHAAPVAKSVDARDSKSRFFGSACSSQARGTKYLGTQPDAEL